jgi:hypothetical protein
MEDCVKRNVITKEKLMRVLQGKAPRAMAEHALVPWLADNVVILNDAWVDMTHNLGPADPWKTFFGAGQLLLLLLLLLFIIILCIEFLLSCFYFFLLTARPDELLSDAGGRRDPAPWLPPGRRSVLPSRHADAAERALL